ncbi:MAG TPA: hypothetical protein VHW44_30310 [Pseudonocardiaceae bacterium]|nr:hypothetical protein [Pseudonocardiaceae bacterium]
MSAGTNHAIRLAEQRLGYWPGVALRFYRRYRSLVYGSGARWLELASKDMCPCGFCEPDPIEEYRDLLDRVLVQLPPKAHGEFARLLDPIDATFVRRTMFEPNVSRHEDWWWRRVRPHPMLAGD